MLPFSANTSANNVLACKARLVRTFTNDWKSNTQEYIVGETLQYSEDISEDRKKELGGESIAPLELHLCQWIVEDGEWRLVIA